MSAARIFTLLSLRESTIVRRHKRNMEEIVWGPFGGEWRCVYIPLNNQARHHLAKQLEKGDDTGKGGGDSSGEIIGTMASGSSGDAIGKGSGEVGEAIGKGRVGGGAGEVIGKANKGAVYCKPEPKSKSVKGETMGEEESRKQKGAGFVIGARNHGKRG